jgi:hypothetical protein
MSERLERTLTGLLVLVAGYFVIAAVRNQFKGQVSPAISASDKPPERLQNWDALVAAGSLWATHPPKCGFWRSATSSAHSVSNSIIAFATFSARNRMWRSSSYIIRSTDTVLLDQPQEPLSVLQVKVASVNS